MSARNLPEADKMGADQETTSRKTAIQALFGSSSSIFLTPELKHDRPHLQGSLIIKDKAVNHCQGGTEAMLQSRFERAVSCFSKAITLQPEQTQLYVQRAEVYLQLCDFKSASLDYKHACYLEPQTEAYFHRLAFVYYMQGQCLCDQGMILEALESFAKAAELKPNYKPYHTRSLACLTALGRYTDCVRLVTNLLETDIPSADLFTLRARLHHQLNQAVLCYYDLKAALRLSPNCGQAQSLLKELEEAAERFHQQAVTKAVEGELADAVGKISTALEQNPEKAQYYLFRGILYRRLKDFIAAIEDLALAVEPRDAGAKSPEGQKPEDYKALEDDAQAQLVLTYNDFAVHCFSQGFYSEATKLLTKAIQEQRDESGLFINRGDCFLKQKEWLFALADYQQAEELDPQNTSIWLRLAIIHNTLGLHSLGTLKFQEAANKFSTSIKYNPGVAQYYGNRAKACFRMGSVEEAKQDAISALILDPTNDELVALLLKLFPGCSLSDVMSSATAATVEAQLMERTQTWKLTGSPASRLSDKLNKMGIGHNTENQSETDFQSSFSVDDVETRQKPSVSLKDPLKSKEQVVQAVRKVLHERQSLYHTGPRLASVHLANTSEPTLSAAKSSYAWKTFERIGLNC
ncbi:tetratricopeptide repeat protein 16 [Salminus brasiliensis]|uniref:tetratricopeptide repeat protein 16 n=1 Tax=Salminus brasiliensis TaxID=930266 RepID=UPI003B83A31B